MNEKTYYVGIDGCCNVRQVDSLELAEKICKVFKDHRILVIDNNQKSISSVAEFTKMIEECRKEWEISYKKELFNTCPLYKIDVYWTDSNKYFHTVYDRNNSPHATSIFHINKELMEKLGKTFKSNRLGNLFYIKSIERIAEPGEKTEFDKV